MPQLLKKEVMSGVPTLDKLLFKIPLALRTESLLDQADVRMRVDRFFILIPALFLTGFIAGLLLQRGPLPALLFGCVFCIAPFVYLLRRRRKRILEFTAQFPDAMDMIARSLRAGHSFMSAMQLVSQEMPEPTSKVFRIAYDEQSLGLSLAESLNNMTIRVESLDLNFFVTAVNIQRESGGNLAEILEKLGVTIRERFKIIGQLRVHTAQGRLSGMILAVLPLALAVVLWLITPDYLMTLFTTRIGIYVVVGAVVLQIIGAVIIRKIINIKI